MSQLNVDTIEARTNNSITLGGTSDTITIPAGATITNSGTANGFGGGNYKNGHVSFNMTNATGTIIVTGVGFQPTHLLVNAVINGSSKAAWSMMGDNTRSVVSYGSSTNYYYNNGFQLRTDAGTMQIIDLTSLDSDGFTLSNSKTGSPTGTAEMFWMAFG